MDVEWRRGALDEIGRSTEMAVFLTRVAENVAEQARRNARGHFPGTDRVQGIDTDFGVDEVSAYANVGYAKTHPGFVLWWSEVGTQKMSPRPHLRAALNQVRF